MTDKKMIEDIVAQVLSEIGSLQAAAEGAKAELDGSFDGGISEADPSGGGISDNGEDKAIEDITSSESRAVLLLKDPEDYDALIRMKSKTTARIGVGRAGGRLNTRTMITLRADHAAAKDAVFLDVGEEIIKRLGLFEIQTKCADKNTFLTRPDLGRSFSDDAIKEIKTRCRPNPDVQIYLSDGLSSTAINANAEKILPAITEGLTSRGISVGTPFFVRFGRVGAQEEIAEALGAKVVCVLIGERPGLATSESMSAYITYEARVGMPESRRTVVSNIHSGGTAAVEAGAYIAELIEKILNAKASGVDLANR